MQLAFSDQPVDKGHGGDAQGLCPPHHWTIVETLEDGYREGRWACSRCGDTKFVRSATWASGRKMSNTSTWTPEDKILGGDEDGDELEIAS